MRRILLLLWMVFVAWALDADVIYAWSENDLRQFNRERKLKEYNNPDAQKIASKWKDFQKEFARLLGTRRRLALSDAVFYLGGRFSGNRA